MSGRDIVVIGGSAGAFEPLLTIASHLSQGFEASVFVVLHTLVSSLSGIGWTISRASGMPVHTVADGDSILPARIYLAPGDRNTLIERGRVRVLASPREHASSPSINALFRSAALAYGPRVVGVVLSGLANDGTAGLWEIKKRGGIAIVQSPNEAACSYMPQSAIENVDVDHCVQAAEIPLLLQKLVGEPLPLPPLRGTQLAKVLIVEDEGIVALNLQKQLVARGYSVSAILSSGEAAIAAVLADTPDVVLMDIYLAGPMDGTEAARAIRDRFNVPIVYLTAYGDEETLSKVKATEAYGYVLKPIDIRQVHVAIQLALERRDKESLPP
jgi:chemotaxis response regulator CheB